MNGREAFIEALKKVALSEIADKNGRVLDASEITGYVVKVHSDEGDELFGTVDVQEYNVESTEIEDQGLHEGVYLNAIQDLSGGVYKFPRLYSDVTIVKDSISGVEFVSHTTLIDEVHVESGVLIAMGVKEREPYEVDGSEDIESKAYTENESWTEYTLDKIVTTVKDKDGNVVSETTTTKDVEVKVGDDVTIKADQKNVDVTVGQTILHIEDGKVTITTTDVEVKADGNVKVDASGNTEIHASGNVDIKGDAQCTISTPQAQIKGGSSPGMFTVNGIAAPNGQGGFCGIPVCPFSGAVHIGNMISGT